jgi:hypothetical protein
VKKSKRIRWNENVGLIVTLKYIEILIRNPNRKKWLERS